MNEINKVWRVTGFYGIYIRVNRPISRNLLCNLANASSIPWLYKRGKVDHPNWLLQGFRIAVANCNLTDLPLLGYQFTWFCGRGAPNSVEERLDRAIILWLSIGDPKKKGSRTRKDRFCVLQAPLPNWKKTRPNIRSQNPMYQNNSTPLGLKRESSTEGLKHVLNRLILTLKVSNHVGGTIVHGKIYSKDRNSSQNILLLIYLVNIYDFGHPKERTPLMLTDGFREISELPKWDFNAVHESWHNNHHLKRGEELEIKFISVASEDITNAINYKGQTRRLLPTSNNKRRNQCLWLTSLRMRYPRGELGEFGHVLQRWTKSKKPLFGRNFSIKKDRSGKENRPTEENDKFLEEPTGSSKFVKKKKGKESETTILLQRKLKSTIVLQRNPLANTPFIHVSQSIV
ncbi:hypothetical protein ACS0TY_001982 [Phlomoides rotata]